MREDKTYKSRLSLDNPLSEAPDEKIGSFLYCSSPLNIGGSQKLNMLSMRSGWVPKFEVFNKSSVSIDKNVSRKAPSGIQSSFDCGRHKKLMLTLKHTKVKRSFHHACITFHQVFPTEIIN